MMCTRDGRTEAIAKGGVYGLVVQFDWVSTSTKVAVMKTVTVAGAIHCAG